MSKAGLRHNRAGGRSARLGNSRRLKCLKCCAEGENNLIYFKEKEIYFKGARECHGMQAQGHTEN